MMQAGDSRRRELEYQIEDLRAKQNAARRKLDELERSGPDSREDSRARMEATREKLRHVVRMIVSRMR